MSTKTTTVNLFGGPGTGKSTTAAYVFALLKLRGVNAELVPEYAKRKVWEESIKGVARNQLYIFAKQQHAVFCCLGKVDVVVTDSPLLLSLHHGAGLSKSFKALVLEEALKQNPLNIFLLRAKTYNPTGRTETEEEAKRIDVSIRNILDLEGIPYQHLAANENAAHKIVEILEEKGIIPKKE